jgi:hypothetical protein
MAGVSIQEDAVLESHRRVPGMRRRDRVLFIDNLQGWIVTFHSNVTLKVTILAKISLREREGAL